MSIEAPDAYFEEHGTVIKYEPTFVSPKSFTAAELERMEFPPVPAAVDGLFLAGLTILAGPPKLGKSWFITQAALAVAGGEPLLGNWRTHAGDVLYCTLEDGARRLQGRMRKLMPIGGFPQRLTFRTELPPLGQGLEDIINEWHRKAAAPRMLVIDTIARVRPPAKRGESYANDYRDIGGLQQLAIELNIPIVAIHHTRKAGGEDFLEEVSGTYGVSGAADSIVVMKRDRASGAVSLSVRGRDVLEAEYALRFEKDTCRWQLQGTLQEARLSDAKLQIMEALGSDILGPKEISELTDLNLELVKKTLQRMAVSGEIEKGGRGKYAVPSVPLSPRADWGQGD